MLATLPLPNIEAVRERLRVIFAEGISDRNYLIREMAARTVFVMLYIDAIEGEDVWLAPKQIIRMCDEQAAQQDEQNRVQYRIDSMRGGYRPPGASWYQDNTREPIRDETIRQGFIAKGAVITREGLPTTSSKGRYALKQDFARLFIVADSDFATESEEWRSFNLSTAELARVRIMGERQTATGAIEVNIPGGGSRTMTAGPSSVITKAVVEEFATRHLNQPAVLWISESGNKVIAQDDVLMRDIGLPIDQRRLLPDIVLADLGRDSILIVFVEVVATDGPITEARKSELIEMISSAGYSLENVAFVSAFEQRGAPPLKARLSGIAVDSLIWCMAEPDLLIWLREDHEMPFDLRRAPRR